jgi:hypothetical protein
MKYSPLLLIVIGFVSCQNSTRLKITGIWDSSYTNDDITMSSTTTFSEGKNKYFITKGNLVTSNGRYNCKFSANGDFRITENNILSLKYTDISIYGCNSNYVESKIRAILGKLKHQTFSHRILSLDSETMITEDMDTYKKTTYIKNEYLEKQGERVREKTQEMLDRDNEKNNHSMYGKRRR